MIKLHLGCGPHHLPGWTNIDLNQPADIIHDLTKPLPFADNSVDFIMSAHFIEHLNHNDGRQFLKNCFRVLKKDGVMRISTPCLEEVTRQYKSKDWKNQDWINRFGYGWLQTPCEMFNVCMRDWGHQFLYDYEQLSMDLYFSGFNSVVMKKMNQSEYKDLQNLEHRNPSDLIIEVIK